MLWTCRNVDDVSENDCNFGCSCQVEWFEPVCGAADGLTYFSPCYAGCRNFLGDTVSHTAWVTRSLKCRQPISRCDISNQYRPIIVDHICATLPLLLHLNYLSTQEWYFLTAHDWQWTVTCKAKCLLADYILSETTPVRRAFVFSSEFYVEGLRHSFCVMRDLHYTIVIKGYMPTSFCNWNSMWS